MTMDKAAVMVECPVCGNAGLGLRAVVLVTSSELCGLSCS
jgi:hypothetical protein